MRLEARDYWNDDFMYECNISREEARMLQSIKPSALYRYLKQFIGKVTQRGESRFIPQYKVGNLKLSLQISYYLWSIRCDEQRQDDNSPITEEEFIRIVGDSAEDGRVIDVKAWWDGNEIIEATQMSLETISNELYNMIKED